MAVPGVMTEWNLNAGYPRSFALQPAGYALAIVALLACAQGLIRVEGGMGRRAGGWGAAVAALIVGSRLVGSAMTYGLGPDYPLYTPLHTLASWHTALLAAGLAGLAPAVWLYRRGDRAAAGLVGNRSWQRAAGRA